MSTYNPLNDLAQMLPQPEQRPPISPEIMPAAAGPTDFARKPPSDHKEFLKGLLSNFLFSLGQGLQASAQAPYGSQGGAGMGAAIAAPFQLEELRRKQAREQQQAEFEQWAKVQALIHGQEQLGQTATEGAANRANRLATAGISANRPVTVGIQGVVSPEGKVIVPPRPSAPPSVEQQGLTAWLADPANAGKNAADYLNRAPRPSALVAGRDIPYPPEVEAQRKRLSAAGMAASSLPTTDEPVLDKNSQSILAQTGLSYPAFMVLTGQTSSLSRDMATRKAAMAEAGRWANKHNVDISTMGSQYKTYNEVLSRNISRMNNTKIMEGEIQGTIQNIQSVANDKDLSKLRFANVVSIWAGKEVNDSLAQQYSMHLYQLRTELAAYAAATQGRTGNEINLQDYKEAENVIRDGVAKGSLSGLSAAVDNSTKKMAGVMQKSVDNARKYVWDLFGVGQNYKKDQILSAVSDPLGIRK